MLICEKDKLSFEYCRMFLKERGFDYTDEQVKEIRDFLYQLAEISYDHVRSKLTELAEQESKS